MNYDFDVMSPPQRLAIAYAKSEFRGFLSLLLEFDSRLKAVCLRTSEPLIGQLKLAWWRDAINADAHNRPTGEPLLAKLADIEGIGQGDTAQAAMLDLLAGWEALIVQPDDVMAMTGTFALRRSTAIFSGFATVSGLEEHDSVLALGSQWALADMGGNDDAEAMPVIGRAMRHRGYRPLTILALAAQLQRAPKMSNGIKLSWHALTGL